jgi:hypothetical protein
MDILYHQIISLQCLGYMIAGIILKADPGLYIDVPDMTCSDPV